MQQERQFPVMFTQQELTHIGILIDHKAKAGYEDGLAGAQRSLGIVAKLNESARKAAEEAQKMNGQGEPMQPPVAAVPVAPAPATPTLPAV